MSSTRAAGRSINASRETQGIAPGTLAWIAVLPCAALTAVVVLLLGPPLGDLLLPPDPTIRFWPNQPDLRPEPTEDARYLLALLAPLLVSAVVALRSRIGLRLAATTQQALVRVVQALALLLLVASVVVQQTMTFRAPYYGEAEAGRVVYFTPPTLVVAVLLAGLACVLLARDDTRARLAGWARETPARRRVGLALAALYAAAWLLTAVNTDASIVNTHYAVSGFLLYTLDEAFAVVNGRTPLVDFHTLYDSLIPYPAAAALSLFGSSLLVYTLFMATLTGATMLAIYDVLRRVTRSSLAALAVYLPVAATGFFMFLGPLDNRYANSNLFSMFPLRYGGAYLMAWLTARHLDQAWPRRRWPLFLVAGVVLLNNTEFGLAALGGLVAAVVWSERAWSWPTARRALGEAAAGLAGGIALVSLLTLVRSGELPHLSMLTEYSRLFTIGGWAMLPMRAFTFHWALYATYAAALVLATVRAAEGHDGRVLTGMLAFAGVFGLGTAGRYVGESHPEGLITLFSAWAFALGLLAVAVVGAIASRPTHRPTLADLAVLLAFGLAVCSIAQTPTPWSQIERLGQTTPREDPKQEHARRFWGSDSPGARFVAADTQRGEQVLILLPLGHRYADELGLVNVSPYISMEAMPTIAQFRAALRALRDAGGTKVFLQVLRPEPEAELERLGYERVRIDEVNAFSEWVDTRGGG